MTKNERPEGPTKDDIAWYLKVIAGQKKEIQRLQELKGGSELKTLKKENLRLRQKLDLMPTTVDLGCGTPKPLYELFDATGMTYYALGKASDIPAQNVKKTIDDGANIRIETAIKLTSTLGVTLSDVLWGVGRPKESTPEAGRDSND